MAAAPKRNPAPASGIRWQSFSLSVRSNSLLAPESMAKLALLSVSDKRGLVEFAAALCNRHGYTLLSTGGTAKLLAGHGLPVTEVSRHTGFPEIMEGRVKTLHPKIHGGLLCRRDKPEHLAEAERNGIELIDLVAVNLYPFEQTVARPGVDFEEAVENIDIGGPSMLRSAAKNFESVTVVCDPDDYGAVLESLEGRTSGPELRRRLALKVFQRTAAYDGAIARYLESQMPAAEPDLDKAVYAAAEDPVAEDRAAHDREEGVA